MQLLQRESPIRWYARSSIGAKQLMAVTGALVLAFAVAHMTSHLLMFVGRDAYNAYAHWAQNLGHGSIKWIVRFGLLGLLVIHGVCAVRLARRNRAARPVPYARYKPRVTTPWARAMMVSGVVVGAFLTFHIVHFTAGLVQPDYFHLRDALGRYDAYTMFVRGFENRAILVVYLVGITLLMLHLRHGIASTIQSLGLDHPRYARKLRAAGPLIALVLYLGFIAPPVAIALGVIDMAG